MPIRVVIADDHPLVLRGLESLLHSEPDFQVVTQCPDGEQALEAVRAHKPDILVLDLHMPRKNGLEVLKELKAGKVPTRAVLFVAELDDEELLEATRQDVAGVVLKEMRPDSSCSASGKCTRVSVGSSGRPPPAPSRRCCGARSARESWRGSALTPREIEMAKMVTRGSPSRNKAIAELLFVSESTVKTHLHSIFEKLGVRSRAELTTYCNAKGIR